MRILGARCLLGRSFWGPRLRHALEEASLLVLAIYTVNGLAP